MRIRFEKQKEGELVDAIIFIKGGQDHGNYASEGKDKTEALENLCEFLGECLQDEIKFNSELFKKLKRVNKIVEPYYED